MTPEKIAEVADPMARLHAARKAIETAEAKAEEARAERDTAVMVAHLEQGVSPVVIYRDTLGIARNAFTRIIARAPASGLPDWPDALARAKAAHRKVVRHDAVIEKVRRIRIETAADILDSGAETNAEVSRASGLSTARIAQIRNGQ